MTKRQSEIPGTERPNSIPELDAAAEKFKTSSKKRKRAQDAEIEDRETVITIMKKHELTVYEDRDADLIVTLSSKDTVKVADLNEDAEDKYADENETPVEAHRKLEPRATKKPTPDAAA